MKPNIKGPRSFIHPLLSRKSIDEASFNQFKQALAQYQHALAAQISAKQSEPNIVTNALKPFFDLLGYKSQAHSQSGQSGIDLALVKNGKPSVIVEAKVVNSKDMITTSDLNKKAFHEAVLYFMRERDQGNDEMFHIIITDFYNWFVFDAKDFDRLFWRNPPIKKLYNTFKSPSLLGDTTAEFYKSLEGELPNQKVDLLDPELIDCAHFNVQHSNNDKALIAIHKLLSKDCLLKEFNPNDANSLNKEFYNELLYILGLDESKEKGKKLIGRAKSPQHGTLYENISNKLSQYQKPSEFENVIKLIIIWVNRILFLKLLESQIANWTQDNLSKFLQPGKISQYDQLETLFFEVLAKPLASRTAQGYEQVPYLNSSLFEIHQDEKNGITIATLADDLEIDYYAKTVVKDINGSRKTGKVSALPYLMEFLDAYDFANDSEDEIVSSAKSLISASVLGLIFEKINGYKDGSFYTPSFITMYMARETILKAVLDKFNQIKNWKCKTLTDLYNQIDDIAEANCIINSIKICDPAIGSGHFLVSALNEMLRIKSELGILVDESGKRIKNYTLSIENDELIIKNDEGELFEYKKGSAEKTLIQKTLFKEKQVIIENCLFGVDINPNSVNICRLRLWIELLKSAYYKTDGTLDTLPNIDINIKCGNSLISRFALTDDLSSKTVKAEIEAYKVKVAQYKQNIGSKYELMQAIAAIKGKFQHSLTASHTSTKRLNDALAVYVKTYSFEGLNTAQKHKAIELNLFGRQDDMFGKAEDAADKAKLHKELQNAWDAVQEIENGKIYENAFEWRFEFPEVLNDAGEFVGFDVVIGNPPYIMEDDNKSAFDGLHDNPCYQGKADIWHLFTYQGLQVIKQGGVLSYIAKNQWLESQSASKMRKEIYEKSAIQAIVDFGTNMVFDEASQQTMLFILQKNSSNAVHDIHYKKFLTKLTNAEIANLLNVTTSDERVKILHKPLPKDYPETENLTFSDALSEVILNKIEAKRNFEFDEKTEIIQGIIGGPDEAFIVSANELSKFNEAEKQYLKMFHTSTGKYYTPPVSQYIFYLSGKNFTDKKIEDYPNIEAFFSPNKSRLMEAKTRYGTPNKPYFYLHRERDEAFFSTGDKLVWAKRTEGSKFTFTDKPLYGTANLFFIKSSRVNLRYITALLNSKLMAFYMHERLKHTGDLLQIDKNQFMRIALFVASNETQENMASMVDAIIAAKQNGEVASQLERELDTMVYALYGLEEEEITLIEAAT